MLLLVLGQAAAAQTQAPATQRPGIQGLTGQVVDGRTGSPLEKVLVTIEGTDRSALTDASGAFQIDGLQPGSYRLQVSVVGYALYQRDVSVGAGPAAPLTIRLTEGTTTYAETVTVTNDVFRSPPDPIVSAQVLGNAELLNLKGVLADDPLRAVQVLPGVATGDDFQSEFTVRGSDFRHLTFTVDGFATPYLLHTVRGVEDRGPTGSVAMINSDVLEDVTLMNGGYPQRYGGHTGAEVDFRLREGSRERRTFHLAASGTNASAVAEGPIGSKARGSWLVSARQSYLDLIVHRITQRAITFGFTDAQAKAVYDLSPRQRLEFTALGGRSRFANDPTELQIDGVAVGRNASVVGIGGWRLTLPRALITQRILGAQNHFRNENPSHEELDRGHDRQLAYRADATVSASSALEVSAGAEAERLDDSRLRRRLGSSRLALVQLDDYSGDALRTGGYVAARWTAFQKLTVSPGVRADHTTLTRQTTTSPWLQVEWTAAPNTKLRAAAGRYQQFAEFDRVLGVSGGRNLRPERAEQYDGGVEQRIGGTIRVSAAIYDREEHDMIFRLGAETQLVGSRVVRGSASAVYANALEGFARGVELTVRRATSGPGLSGWFSYAYGRNRYHDVLSDERFWGDADQRHTMNAYALYRRSDRASFVGKLRIGSNFPIPGYFAETNGAYFITSVRNTTRLPTYARLDLRGNRTFNWTRRRLTLFAEVINVLNRENVRFNPPGINTTTHLTTSKPFLSTLPIVPSAGVLIEF